jgi:hypothetical protein
LTSYSDAREYIESWFATFEADQQLSSVQKSFRSAQAVNTIMTRTFDVPAPDGLSADEWMDYLGKRLNEAMCGLEIALSELDIDT